MVELGVVLVATPVVLIRMQTMASNLVAAKQSINIRSLSLKFIDFDDFARW